ncbi:MAG: fasciclin domain-containing protein [Spirochaetia bacterium]
MLTKKIIAAIFLVAFALTPIFAQVQPGDADETSTADAVEEHEETSVAGELFTSEFGSLLDGEENVALFAPKDEVMEDEGIEEISGEELESLFNRHTATGLASQEPLEYVQWFVTEDGEKISVSEKDDTLVLNDSVEVIEAIPAKNGVVYVIDGSLDE